MFSMFSGKTKKKPNTPFNTCEALASISLAFAELEAQVKLLEKDKNNINLSRNDRRLANQKYEVLDSLLSDLGEQINAFNKLTAPVNLSNLKDFVTKLRTIFDYFVMDDMYANIRLLNRPRGINIKQFKQNSIVLASISPSVAPPLLGVSITLPVIAATVTAGLIIAKAGMYFFNPKETKTRSIQKLDQFNQAILSVEKKLQAELQQVSSKENNTTILDIAPKIAW